MARVTKQVDKNTLIEAIATAEANGPLKNLNALWEAAAAIYNTKAVPDQISFSVVALRAKEWGLTTKTQPGKKGRQGPMSDEHKAKMLGARGIRKSRKDKFAANPEIAKAFAVQRSKTPITLHQLIDRAEKGSVKAAIKLMCHACMGHDNAVPGIRNCTSPGCPLFPFRPHQAATDNEDVGTDDADTEVESDSATDSAEAA